MMLRFCVFQKCARWSSARLSIIPSGFLSLHLHCLREFWDTNFKHAIIVSLQII